jgi:S-formylglutathione hydrolase FrmB
MAFFQKTIESKSLGLDIGLCVQVPDFEADIFPTVYLQHGLGDDHNTPWEKSRLLPLAEDHDLIIVTADAKSSWFVNDERSGKLMWEDFFVFELPEYIEKNFPAASSREGRGQCGFSMGGYGAMLYTMKHPDRFSAVSTHCGSFAFGHEYRKDRPERAAFMEAVAPPGGEYDLFRLAEKLKNNPAPFPVVRMDIGDQDHLLDQNRHFHAHLDENLVKHEYKEHKGSHLWSYVDAHLAESLAFFSASLRV